jgi:hypothetical protein
MTTLKRHLLAAVLALVHGLVPAQATAPAPAPVFADTVQERTAQALFWGDWDELERLHAAARTDTQRAQEGSLAACLFARGIGRDYADESLPYFESRVAGTREWVQRRPDSALAHAVHVHALVDLAWFHRGSGFANTVSDQRFADFRAKLNEALAYVKANSAALTRHSFYTRPLLTLMRGLGVGVDKQMEVARHGLRKEPGDECIYLRVVDSLVPKWGGEPQELESWVRESMKGLPDAAALARYARMYDVAASADFQQGLFENSLARWPLMRDGLRQLIAESPRSRYWKNRLGYYACMAKDRDAAAPALEAIEAAPSFDAWGSNGQRTYQGCKRWALQS